MSGVNIPDTTCINGGNTYETSGGAEDALAPGHSKRQRRPNVRLGDQPSSIPHDPHPKRTKTWKHYSGTAMDGAHHYRGGSKAPSRTRNVAVLDAGDALDTTVDRFIVSAEENLEPLAAAIRGTREFKDRKTAGGGGGGVGPLAVARRVRTNWNLSKTGEGFEFVNPAEIKSIGREDVGDEGYRDVDGLSAEDSESPSDTCAPSTARVRTAEAGDMLLGLPTDAVEEDVPSEADRNVDWDGLNGRCVQPGSGSRGVRSWLNHLGLVRYAPVFDIHEVDDEVLPMLTLEDLKDMGINAVGSRRKIYCAIQKLKKGSPLDSGLIRKV